MMIEHDPIVLAADEAIDILREIETILISLHKIGAYYGCLGESTANNIAYALETNRFIDEWQVTQRLANIRAILSSKFDNAVGDDNMAILERELEYVSTWELPATVAKRE